MTSLIIEYYKDTHCYPESLKSLYNEVGIKYDSNHRTQLYLDPYTGLNNEVKEYNGNGGWVFSIEDGILALNYKPLFFTPKSINWKDRIKKLSGDKNELIINN